MSAEIVFDYREMLWFQPVTGDYVELDHWSSSPDEPLPVTDNGRALIIPTNMFAGPIRFRLLIDIDEGVAAAELGPHERLAATQPFRTDGSPYGLEDGDGTPKVLASSIPAGDYQAVLLRSGTDEAKFDNYADESDERYWLLLTSIHR